MLPGSSALRPMPRKTAGRLISRIEPLMAAASMPSVVLLRTIHLWLCGRLSAAAFMVVTFEGAGVVAHWRYI